MTTQTGTCERCKKDFEFPIMEDFQAETTCPHCGAVHNVEVELHPEGGMYYWLDGIVGDTR